MRLATRRGLTALATALWLSLLASSAHGLMMVNDIINADAARLTFPNVDGVNDFTGKVQRIAVLDTGVQYNHPSLGGAVVGGINYGASADWAGPLPSQYTDGHGHGTFIGGVIASHDAASPGIAPQVEIISVRIAAANGQASFSDIAYGLEWVAANAAALNITAVNLSFGSTTLYHTESEVPNWTTNRRLGSAFASLKQQDIVTAVASGNDGSSKALSMPAIFDSVVAVGASADNDTLWSSTNRNAALDLLAPGVGVSSLWKNGGTSYGSGTSYASPMVAAASVLIRDAIEYFTDDIAGDYPTFQDRVVDLLQTTGKPIYDPASDLTFSRIDIDAALHHVYAEYGAHVQVPEPGSVMLMIAGLIVLARGRKSSRAA